MIWHHYIIETTSLFVVAKKQHIIFKQTLQGTFFVHFFWQQIGIGTVCVFSPDNSQGFVVLSILRSNPVSKLLPLGSATHLKNIPKTLKLTGRVAPENRPKLPQKGKENVCQPQRKKNRLLCASLLWTDPQRKKSGAKCLPEKNRDEIFIQSLSSKKMSS